MYYPDDRITHDPYLGASAPSAPEVDEPPPLTAAEHAARCAQVAALETRLRICMETLRQEVLLAQDVAGAPHLHPLVALNQALYPIHSELLAAETDLWVAGAIDSEQFLWTCDTLPTAPRP